MLEHWLSGRRPPRPKDFPGSDSGRLPHEAVRVQDELSTAAGLLLLAFGLPPTKTAAKELRRHEPAERFLRACGWAVRFGLLTVLALRWTEGMAFSEAVWQLWQTATTVGYGNQPAATEAGRWTIMILGTFDIGFVGYAISTAFGLKDHVADLRRHGHMPNPHDGALLIVHSPGERDLKILVRGVREEHPGLPVCVVDARLDGLPHEISVLPDVHFIKGSPLNPAVLERARAKQASAAVVYALDKDLPDSDAATVTVVRQLWSLDAAFPVSYFLVEPLNGHLFDNDFQDARARGRSRPTAIPRHLATMAAVQAVRSAGAGETLASLIRQDDGIGLATLELRPRFGTDWGRLCTHVQEAARIRGIGANAVALLPAAGGTKTCPRASDPVFAGDKVVLNAPSGVDWDLFHAELAWLIDEDARKAAT